MRTKDHPPHGTENGSLPVDIVLALEYYGDPAHYGDNVTLAGNRGPGVLRERGDLARELLAKYCENSSS